MTSFPRKALGLLCCAAIFGGAAIAGDGGHPPGPGGEPMGRGREAMFLHGVHLTEAQQDKVFAIRHAEEPAMRDQAKALRHAHEALRAMAVSGQFDDTKAAALAQAGANAMAAIELQRARTHAQIYALLTPEQRSRAAERRPHREAR